MFTVYYMSCHESECSEDMCFMLWNNSLTAICQGKHVWPTVIEMGIHKYNTQISFLNGAYNKLWEQSMIWNSLIIMETRLWAGQSKVWIPAGERDFSILQNVQTGSGVIRPPTHWIPGFFPRAKSWGVMFPHITMWCFENSKHERLSL